MPKSRVQTTKRNKFGGFVFDNLLFQTLEPIIGEKSASILITFQIFIIPLLIIFVIGFLSLLTSISLSSNQFKQQSGAAIIGDLTETSLNGITAKVLDVPYFNQWISEGGITGPTTSIIGSSYPLGQIICGAASSTMIAGYFKKIPFTTGDNLKLNSYQNTTINLPNYCKDQGVPGGAFGVTAKGYCNQSSFVGISEYFSLIGLKSQTIGITQIIPAINNGFPLILSINAPLGHILVIKGYTSDGKIVTNDPFGDLNNISAGYSFKGNNAIYDLSDPKFVINSIMQVSETN
ncbi:MAG: C39 family peptidase [candidate division SR1 bacterium]|nr:C39 family peptidase [candidate division SR1 bacterium]